MKCTQNKCQYEAEVTVRTKDGKEYAYCCAHAGSAVAFGNCTYVSEIREIEIPDERLEILK